MEIYSVKILDINEEKLNKLCLSIDSNKKSRIQKFHNKEDKIRTLIGEILIRTIIIKELDIRNNNIKFAQNQYNKPYLKSHTQFNFNISHSGRYVLCAVDNKPIGIDVEEVKPIDYKNIVKRFFYVSESNYIFNQKRSSN